MLIYHAGMFSVWIIISYENILWVVIRAIQSTGRVSIGNRNVRWKPIREFSSSFLGRDYHQWKWEGDSIIVCHSQLEGYFWSIHKLLWHCNISFEMFLSLLFYEITWHIRSFAYVIPITNTNVSASLKYPLCFTQYFYRSM